jgi:hypothetical protein
LADRAPARSIRHGERHRQTGFSAPDKESLGPERAGSGSVPASGNFLRYQPTGG